MKTYLFGALFGILLMLGAVLLFGVAGGTGYAALGDGLAAAPPAAVGAGGLLVLSGLLFKAGGVPAHFWVPDATEGASVTAAAFLTTIPKVGAVVAVARLVTELPGDLRWASVLGVVAVASMTIGNLAAFAQTDVRRLLGWSTVSQVGYLLAAAAVAERTALGQPSPALLPGRLRDHQPGGVRGGRCGARPTVAGGLGRSRPIPPGPGRRTRRGPARSGRNAADRCVRRAS